MSDTAQPLAAENDGAQIDNAANAFKSFLNPAPAQPRDDRGRFAPTSEEAEPEEDLTEEQPTGNMKTKLKTLKRQPMRPSRTQLICLRRGARTTRKRGTA